jgi:DNA-binding MarR family transcriptional regulator
MGMGRKKQSEELLDPIAAEARMRERAEYLSDLFLPIIPQLQHRPTPWVVQDLIPEGSLCLLAAEPKEGKTSLATALALAVATGTPFAGRNTKQGAVLWIAAEESRQERNYLLDQSPLVDSSLPLYTCHQHLPIDDQECLDAVRHWVSQTQANLIVVDPLLAATSGRSLRDGWNARRSLQMLKKFCALHRVAALVLHHRKDAMHGLAKSRAAENDQLSATASMVMSMRVRKLDPIALALQTAPSAPLPLDAQEEVPGMVVRPLKSPTIHPRLIALDCAGRGDFANQTIWLLSRGPLDYVAVQESPPHDEEPQIRIGYTDMRIMLEIEKRPKDSGQLMDVIHIPPGTLRNALTRLRRRGMVEVRVWQDGARRYRLTQPGRDYVRDLKELENNEQENKGTRELDSKLALSDHIDSRKIPRKRPRARPDDNIVTNSATVSEG